MSKRFMYVWEYAGGLTNNWHDGGGTVVIAASLEAARSLLKETPYVRPACEVFTKEPEYSAPVESQEDKVFIFPDAGCC